MAEPTQKQSDVTLTEQARQGLERSKSGKARGARQLDDVRRADPAGAEAAEQEASMSRRGVGCPTDYELTLILRPAWVRAPA